MLCHLRYECIFLSSLEEVYLQLALLVFFIFGLKMEYFVNLMWGFFVITFRGLLSPFHLEFRSHNNNRPKGIQFVTPTVSQSPEEQIIKVLIV